MTSGACETVKIKHENDFGNDHLVINKSDFDPEKHELFDGDEVDIQSANVSQLRSNVR